MTEDRWEKKTIRLRAGDYERLQQLHARVGANAIIRRLVEDYLDQVDPAPRLSPDMVADIGDILNGK